MDLTGSNIEPHNSVLPVSKELIILRNKSSDTLVNKMKRRNSLHCKHILLNRRIHKKNKKTLNVQK